VSELLSSDIVLVAAGFAGLPWPPIANLRDLSAARPCWPRPRARRRNPLRSARWPNRLPSPAA